MNVSRIFRLSFIFVLMVFFVLVSQYYVNCINSLKQLNEDLKIAIFIKDNIELSSQEIVDKLNELNYVNILEYIDNQTAYNKAVELSPELSEIFSQEEIHYPAYILTNKPNANDIKTLENIKTELKLLEFVDDVSYDKKAYSLFFENLNLVYQYKKILIIIFIAGFVIFVLKFILFCLKKSFKTILSDLAFGFMISILAYVFVCLLAIINKSSVFVLDWHILYLILPLGMIMSFITKETNA
jgi:cell division protein FtsX